MAKLKRLTIMLPTTPDGALDVEDATKRLFELYDHLDEPNVIDTLRVHPGIAALLAEAGPHILGHFGPEARVCLQVEHEYDGRKTLYAMITAPGTDEALLEGLSRFDETWWLSRQISEPLVFTVGHP